MRILLVGLVVVAMGMAAAAAEPPEPAVSILLGPARGQATPSRQGFGHTAGGNIQVTQPAPDTIAVTMTGGAAAKGHPFHQSAAHLHFELAQTFDVVFHSPKVKTAKLVLWGRAVGMLRSHGHGCRNGAEVGTPGQASVTSGPVQLLALNLEPRAVAGGENLSVHDREGPVWVPIAPGRYTLHQAFGITATHHRAWFGKPASADFAPDPALEDRWLGQREPFHGANKKDFGFQVILKVIAEEEANGKGAQP